MGVKIKQLDTLSRIYACGPDITIQQQYTHSAEKDKKKKKERKHRRLVPHPDSGDLIYGVNSCYYWTTFTLECLYLGDL